LITGVPSALKRVDEGTYLVDQHSLGKGIARALSNLGEGRLKGFGLEEKLEEEKQVKQLRF
jgi:hypothetical protein